MARRRVAGRGDADVPRHRGAPARVPAVPAAGDADARRDRRAAASPAADPDRGHGRLTQPRAPAAPATGGTGPGLRLGADGRAHDLQRRAHGDRRSGPRRLADLGHRPPYGAEPAGRPGQRPGAAGGVRAASPLGRGPLAPVTEGPRRQLGDGGGAGVGAALPRRVPARRQLPARRSDDRGRDDPVGRGGAGRVPHPRVRLDRPGPPAPGAVPRPRSRRAAGVPDRDGGDRAAVRRARGRCRAALVDARQPRQPLVRARRRRPGRARRVVGRRAGGARGGRGDHPRRGAGRTAADRQGPRLLAGGGGRDRDDLAGLRSSLRVGRRGLEPARLPDRARRPGGERLHLRAAHGVRPGGGQAPGRAAGGRELGPAVGAGRPVTGGGLRPQRRPARRAGPAGADRGGRRTWRPGPGARRTPR